MGSFIDWFSRSYKGVIIGLVAFGAVMMVVLALQHVNESRPTNGTAAGPVPTFSSEPKATLHIPKSPRVLVVGDSYSAGYQSTTPATDNWATKAATAADWDVTTDAVVGAGYTLDGERADSKFPTRIAKHKGESYDLVILQGSQNDVNASSDNLIDQASAAMSTAKKQWPDAAVVSIGPSAPQPAGDGYSNVSSALSAASARAGIAYINPLAEGWMSTQNSDKYAAEDGQHLNTAGYDYMAGQVVSDLARLTGVTPED